MEFLKLILSVMLVLIVAKPSAVDAKDIYYGVCILLCGFIAYSNKK